MKLSFTQGVIIMTAAFALLVLGFTQHKPSHVLAPGFDGVDEKAGVAPIEDDEAIDTSDWVEYPSEEYGFQAKYPGSLYYWLVKATRGQSDIFGKSLFSATMEQDGSVGPTRVRISVYSAQGYVAPETVDLLAWISDHEPTTPLGDSLLLGEIRESTLDNRFARIARKHSFDSTQRVIIAGHGSFIYTISFDESNTNDPNMDEHLRIYNQILSTFEFIDQ